MVTQYPDTIVITIQAAPEQNPASGVYEASTGASTVLTFDCRAEQNEEGKVIPGADGGKIEFAFEVYMPRTSDIIPRGAQYSLSKGSQTYTGVVLGASNGQLNSRLWL